MLGPIVRSLLKLVYRVQLIGRENCEAAGERTLILHNPSSIIDPLLIAAVLPYRVTLLAVPEVGGGVRRINVRNISYVESFRSERCLYVGDASVRTRLSLQSIQAELDKLCPGRFIAPFRGHLVNLDAVASVTSTCITLVDGRVVPLKAGAFRKTRACYFDWLFRKEDRGE